MLLLPAAGKGKICMSWSAALSFLGSGERTIDCCCMLLACMSHAGRMGFGGNQPLFSFTHAFAHGSPRGWSLCLE